MIVYGRAVERERLPEDRRIAVEALLPDAMADERDVLAARAILVGREVAAEHRLEAQRRQQRRRGVKRRSAARDLRVRSA